MECPCIPTAVESVPRWSTVCCRRETLNGAEWFVEGGVGVGWCWEEGKKEGKAIEGRREGGNSTIKGEIPKKKTDRLDV